MRICSRCIMPDSYPNVTIDSEGICTLCRIHDAAPRLQKPVAGKEALLRVLTSRPSAGYHCVVPLSGGKDSSYVLFYVVRELGLRPLAVFADSGFVVDSAKENIRRICDGLSVDLVVHVARFRREIVREALYIWKHTGKYFSPCPPCETNNRSAAIQEATNRGIPFIVWGASDFEDDDLTFFNPNTPTARQRYAHRLDAAQMTPVQRVKRVFRVTGLGIITDPLRMSIPWPRRLRGAYHGLRYVYYTIRNNLDVNVPEGWRKYLPLVQTSFEGKSVQTIYLFDYVPYDPYSFVDILKRELGWQAPADRDSRMDCRLHALWAYQSLRETGITQDGFTFSVLIRYGLMNRAEAQRREAALARDLRQECARLLDELGVDEGGILAQHDEVQGGQDAV